MSVNPEKTNSWTFDFAEGLWSLPLVRAVLAIASVEVGFVFVEGYRSDLTTAIGAVAAMYAYARARHDEDQLN
jgi:hypothetical protein